MEWQHQNGFWVAKLVPGHGQVGDSSALGAMRGYFVSIRDAIGDKEKLAALKQKYADYGSVPMMSGFEKTVAFIESQMKK
jgi:hypothetical protein